jgi:hypothetical protein
VLYILYRFQNIFQSPIILQGGDNGDDDTNDGDKLVSKGTTPAVTTDSTAAAVDSLLFTVVVDPASCNRLKDPTAGHRVKHGVLLARASVSSVGVLPKEN